MVGPTDRCARSCRIYAPNARRGLIRLSIACPSLGLGMVSHPDDELRPAICRALNQYNADSVRSLGDRLTIPACIPMQNTTEALEELDYAVNVLGMRCVMLSGTVRGGRPVLIGSMGSPATVWQRCIDSASPRPSRPGTRQGSQVSGLYVQPHARPRAGEASRRRWS
jgi:hypothetical protein